MGNSKSFIPNVKERHSSALYINIPIDEKHIDVLNSLTLEPCMLDKFNNCYYLSIIIDDLDILQSYFGCGVFINTGMQGFMCKLNLLVKCSIPNNNNNNNNLIEDKIIVNGYQILSLDFENNFGGNIKVFGAKLTQCIPTFKSVFNIKIHDNKIISGKSIKASYDNGLAIKIEMNSHESFQTKNDSSQQFNKENSNKNYINITGKFDNDLLTSDFQQFISFVINRPYKFLVQYNNNNKSKKLVYSPEDGQGSDFSCDNIIPVNFNIINIDGLLERLCQENENLKNLKKIIDTSKIKCFMQPHYILVDHHNKLV